MNITTLNTMYQGQQTAIVSLSSSTDGLWVSLATYLVFFMQAGFALLEVGTVRAKNAQNILLKNMLDVCIATFTWWLIGYGLAFGTSVDLFNGSDKFAGKGFDNNTNHYRDWMFQWAFAGTAATIVSGSLAERTKILAYVIYASLMTTIIYPLVVHWTWGGGWLTDLGYSDFAGSGIVHMVGGIGGLIGAIVIGPRKNYFNTEFRKQNPFEFDAHNVPFVVLGTLILWLGWYGFNCGSTLSASNPELIAKIGMVTTIGAATGGLTTFLIDAIMSHVHKKPHICVVPCLTNGLLGGLVSITAGCGSMEPYAAFITGLIGGILCHVVPILLEKFKVDDPLDAFAIHGACGAWGVIAVGFFDNTNGLFYSGDSSLLGYQAIGAISIATWTTILSLIIFCSLKKMNMLRVSEKEEDEGLDKIETGHTAYHITNTI